MLNHQATLTALVDTLLRDRCLTAGEDPAVWTEAITPFVTQQRAKMPPLTGAAVRLLTLLLDAWPIARGTRPFHRLAPAERQAVTAAWRASRLGPCRDLLRLHDSLVIFAWYTRREEPFMPNQSTM
ncbi:MAG: hypothetical protein HQL66_10390 [Magnetococcales bacterium]|nr:hypothetical protein [Magnetococcales bacterium]